MLTVATAAVIYVGGAKDHYHREVKITTNGRWKVRYVALAKSADYCQDQCATASCLRAVYRGLLSWQANLDRDGRSMMICCSDQQARELMQSWLAGDQSMPDWYELHRNSGKTPTLQKLAAELNTAPQISLADPPSADDPLQQAVLKMLAIAPQSDASFTYGDLRAQLRSVVAEAYQTVPASG